MSDVAKAVGLQLDAVRMYFRAEHNVAELRAAQASEPSLAVCLQQELDRKWREHCERLDRTLVAELTK